MKRRIATLTAPLVGLVLLAACSSDTALTVTTSMDSGSLPPGVTVPDLTVPDVTTPPDLTVPDVSRLTIPDLTTPPDLTVPDVSDLTIPDLTLPGGVTLPPGLTIPDFTIPDISIPDISIPDVTFPSASIPADKVDCTTFSTIFASIFTGQQSGLDDIDAKLADLRTRVPEDLTEEFDAATEGMLKLGDLYAKYGYDYGKILTDPEAMQIFADQDFILGIGALEEYYGKQCAS